MYRTLSYSSVSLLLMLGLLAMTGCASSRPASTSMTIIEGTSTKRIAAITAMLTQFHAPPTPILDAQFVEEKFGDDELGPADYRAFMLIEVAPDDVADWQAILTSLDATPSYPQLPQTFTWWIAETAFDSLQFYAPETFTGRTNGWVAIDAQNGKIYIYSFTT